MHELTESTEATFSKRVREERESAGLSQTELARKLDGHGLKLDPTAITRLERGSRAIRLGEAVAIAEVLGQPLPEMLRPRIESALAEAEWRAQQATIDAARARGALQEAEKKEKALSEAAAALKERAEARAAAEELSDKLFPPGHEGR